MFNRQLRSILFASILFFVSYPLSTMAKEAVMKIIERRIGTKLSTLFKVEKLQSDNHTFEIEECAGEIVLRGDNHVSQASAFNWYLKHVANGQVSWNGDQIPRTLPAPTAKIRKVSPYKWNNYYNYCTHSYTMAFKDWNDWEREIDIMAMRGINLALILPGHEKVWQNTLKRLGYSTNDIESFIPTSAHTAWWLMANMENPDMGVVSQSIIDGEAELGRKICDRMRELDMEPAVNGFFGMVPTTFKNYFPKAKIIPQGNWGAGIRPMVLSPLDPMFKIVSQIWYEELEKIYGKINFYSGDLFHEGGKTGGLPLGKCANAVQEEMIKHNRNAIWFMQSWQVNPRKEMVKACKKNQILIQQLAYSANNWGKRGYWGKLRTFNDAKWTLSFVINFGGGEGYNGNLKALMNVANFLQKQEELKDCVGLGVLCEGTRTNPINYDMISDLVWLTKGDDINKWLAGYLKRRYGENNSNMSKAWDILKDTVYNINIVQEGQTDSILSAIPKASVIKARHYGRGNIWYSPLKLINALAYMLKAAPQLRNQQTYRHDLIDLARQVTQDYARFLHPEMMDAYDSKDKARFNKLSTKFIELIDDCDALLATSNDFLVGTWLEDARKKGSTKSEKEKMERSARYLITQWSPRSGQALSDYSNRQWAGLMKDYYKPRWELFINSLKKSLKNPSQANDINKKYFKDLPSLEKKWINSSNSNYSTKPTGDFIKEATNILKKYGQLMKKSHLLVEDKKSRERKWVYDLSKSNKKVQIMEWDCYSDIQTLGIGTYALTFKYQKGQSALEIDYVELIQNGKILARDEHHGWTGWEHKGNTYTLKLKEIPATVAPYFLRAKVHGASGNDSKGHLIFRKIK